MTQPLYGSSARLVHCQRWQVGQADGHDVTGRSNVNFWHRFRVDQQMLHLVMWRSLRLETSGRTRLAISMALFAGMTMMTVSWKTTGIGARNPKGKREWLVGVIERIWTRDPNLNRDWAQLFLDASPPDSKKKLLLGETMRSNVVHAAPRLRPIEK